MSTIARAYFFDKSGRELIDHPLNGKVLLASSGSPKRRDGTIAGLYCLGVQVCSYCDMHRTLGRHDVTLSDFPGHDRVGVKLWFGPDRMNKVWLVEADYFTSRESIPNLRIVA